MNKLLKHFFERLILPQACLLCGALSKRTLCSACLEDLPYLNSTVCPRCASSLPPGAKGLCGDCLRNPPPFNGTSAVFHYGYPLDKLLLAAKYAQNMAALRLLGELTAEYLHFDAPPAVLIPTPMYPADLRRRGYNQVVELAKIISRRHQIPLAVTACRCIKKKRPQASLPRKERFQNVKGVFKVDFIHPAWQQVAIVDDTMTTGATAGELAKVLLQAGVKQVDVWCCARTQEFSF